MKTPKRTMGRRAEALAVVCLVACLGALGLRAATQTTTFEPAAATVGNARILAFAITQYVQDYDEKLPPMHTAVEFQKSLQSYVPDPSVFISRVTSQPFIPNSAISGLAVTSFSNPYAVAVFQDTATQSTVGFLDGHIERGGVVQDPGLISSYLSAETLADGVLQYTQDCDGVYPPMKTQAEFQAALLPYVHRPKIFIDSDNGKPFVPNAALSGVSVASINDPAHTILLQSAMPYKNGIPTIAYTDGHVTPVPSTTIKNIRLQDFRNLQKIGLATIEYTQENNEVFPNTNDYTAFETALEPYLKDTSIFVSPDSGLRYILNPAISGVNVAYIVAPASTEVARDAQPNFDGSLNHLEVDGHVHQDFYFVPRSLVVDTDDQTHLFWLKDNRQAALWTLSPHGTTKYIDTLNGFSPLNYFNTPLAFSVGADGQSRVLWQNIYNTNLFQVPITGAITLDTLGTDGSLENSTQFGPYDGWTALLLTTGADNTSRLLWQRYDGTLALWTLSPEGDFVGSVTVPTFKGGTPVGLALGTDGLTRLLWKTAHGDATIWTVAENGQVVRSFGIPSPPHYTLTGLGLGVDGASRFLWGDGQGHAAVLTLTANGGFEGYVTFALPSGGTASQIGVGKAGDLRVLWEASDGSGQLQTLTATGKQTNVQSLTPYL